MPGSTLDQLFFSTLGRLFCCFSLPLFFCTLIKVGKKHLFSLSNPCWLFLSLLTSFLPGNIYITPFSILLYKNGLSKVESRVCCWCYEQMGKKSEEMTFFLVIHGRVLPLIIRLNQVKLESTVPCFSGFHFFFFLESLDGGGKVEKSVFSHLIKSWKIIIIELSITKHQFW